MCCVRTQQLRSRAIAEIVGRQIGKQRHADVRWTGARRDHQVRILLDVVRWQPIVFRRNELFEVPPRLARKLFEKLLLILGEPQRRLAELADSATRRPAAKQSTRRSRAPHRAVPRDGRTRVTTRRRGGQRGSESHRAERVRQASVAASFRIAGRLPFEQPPLGPSDAHQRAHNRIAADVCLVRQKDERQQALWASGRPKDCSVARKCMRSGKSTGL